MKEDNKFVTNCMVPGCERDTYGGSRGMCINHYVVLSSKVRRGGITWKELEDEGRARPKLTQAEQNENRRHPQREHRRRQELHGYIRKSSPNTRIPITGGGLANDNKS